MMLSVKSISADLILIVHVAFVLFVVFGLILIIWGGLRNWRWIRNPWFRVIHLLAIIFVAIQAWCGEICPLTRWEMAIRRDVSQTTYEGSFIAHWLGKILYYDLPSWVFVTAYTLFALVVILCWTVFKPRSFSSNR